MTIQEPFPRVIPVSRPHFWGQEHAFVKAALDSGFISGMGAFVNQLESDFVKYMGGGEAVAVSSGTDAINLALEVLGIGPDDEVILPDLTMISPLFAVLARGACPVLVDVDKTWNMDPLKLGEAISDRTKCILVVHNYGHPADMRAICDIAQAHNIPIVEDAAEVLGAVCHGQLSGTFGIISTFSLYSNKVITSGEGGLLFTRDKALAERARWKKNLCFGADLETRFIHSETGSNCRLSNVLAAIGVAQMPYLQKALRERREIAEEYCKFLSQLPGLTLPPKAPWAEPSYWVFAVLLEEELGLERQDVQLRLQQMGVETRRLFSPAHSQPVLSRFSIKGDFCKTQHISDNGFYIPLYCGMRKDEVDRVISCLYSIWSHNGAKG